MHDRHDAIDGHDARRIPLGTLRGAIGYVLQDTFLFSDTIRANIAHLSVRLDPDSDPQEFVRAKSRNYGFYPIVTAGRTFLPDSQFA